MLAFKGQVQLGRLCRLIKEENVSHNLVCLGFKKVCMCEGNIINLMP